MEDLKFSEEYFENVMIKQGFFSSDITSAINLVAKYIKREKLILVGGMAIDLALKRKGAPRIYDDSTIADHDFFTKTHFMDAYEIGQWLIRTKYPDVSVINALHPSSMRVRIHFEPVADVTYMPPIIYEVLPTIMVDGYKVIHPNYQYINQHIALSKPYESRPRETIRSSRWEKDMIRHDLLYKYYPLYIPQEQFKETLQTSKSIEKLKGLKEGSFCLTGLAALVYWLAQAKAAGFESSRNFGSISSSHKDIKIRGPLAIMTDEIRTYHDMFADKENTYFNRQLDHLPRYFANDEYEVFDNKGLQNSATDEGKFHVANPQTIMVYFLTRLMINKSANSDFYYGYLTCRDLVKWAAGRMYRVASNEALYAKLVPTVEVYGKYNISEPYLIQKARKESRSILQPKLMFQYSLRNMSIPEDFKEFSYKDSWVFNIDGQEVKNFLK